MCGHSTQMAFNAEYKSWGKPGLTNLPVDEHFNDIHTVATKSKELFVDIKVM